jgi:protein O-mannosyl-transferase
MANKYQIRRRALKESQARSENPFASPRSGGREKTRAATPYTPPPRMDRLLTTVLLSLVLTVLITALYVQTAGHKFTVCDDNVYIYEQHHEIKTGLTWESIKWAFAEPHEGNWHPLTWLSHMLDWQTFGKWQPENNIYVDSWPGGHHLVSMCLHGANAILLFLALRLMTSTLWPSFIVAALFAVHPLRVESVAWAAERKDVLCGLFWMASMLTYAVYARRRPIYDSMPNEAAGTVGIYVLLCLFFSLGLMAKSMIVTLPCVFILLDIWPLGRWKAAVGQKGRGINIAAVVTLIVEKIPLFLLDLGDCLVTIYGQNKGVALNSFEGLPLSARLYNAVESCGEYLRQTFWPTGLAPFYTHPHMIPDGWTPEFYNRFYIYAALLLMITGAAIWFIRQRPFLAIGWFWYLGALMPVIGIIQVGTQARADRYTYLPMIGVYLMVAWLLKEIADRWPQTRFSLAAACLAALTALSVLTWLQVSYWIDSYKLFEHAVVVTDKNYFAFNHIGIAYDQDAKKDMAAAEAIPDPQTAQARRKFAEEEFDHSADAFRAAIDIKPDYDFGNNNLGVYYARRGKPEDLKLAEKYFRGALVSNQRYADAYNNLAIVLSRQGKYDEAIDMHKRGLSVRIDRASDHNNLCRVYMARADLETKNKESDRANADLESALEENEFALKRCDPNFLGAWLSLVEIKIKRNDYKEAGKCVLRMVTINANAGETHGAESMLAEAYLKAHQPDEAIDLLTECLKINDEVAQVYRLRALVYAQKGDLIHAREDLLQLLKIAPTFPGGKQMLQEIEARGRLPGSR